MRQGHRQTRIGLVGLSLSLGLACQEPFGADRHSLEGWRIAGIQALPAGGSPGDTVVARALVVEDDAVVRRDAELAWYWVDADDLDAVAVLDPAERTPDAWGDLPTLTLPDGQIGRLAVLLLDGDQVVYRALLDVPLTGAATVPALTGVTVARVEAPGLLDIDAEDQEARAAWPTSTTDTVPAGGLLRVEAEVEAGMRTRWMTVGNRGTFWELSRASTDWWAAEATFDGDEVRLGAVSDPGPVTSVVLALDGAGGVSWRAREWFVQTPLPGLTTTSGRWLALTLDGEGEVAVQAELAADAGAPTGLSLVDPVVREALDTADPWGTATLPCNEAVSGPFDPSWLLDGTCTLDQVTGAVVTLEGTL